MADLQVNVPFRWLRLSWLLILQMLIVGLLAGAIGRPALGTQEPSRGRVIILIDQSASMAALVKRSGSADSMTRFDEAKASANRIVDGLAGETRALVAGFASQASALTNFTRDRGLLRKAIADVRATDEPGDFGRACELVRALAGSAGEGAQADVPRVVLLSDGGFPSGVEAGNLGRATLEFTPVPDPAAQPGDNVGIVALSARRDYADPALVRVFARFQSVVRREVVSAVECRVGEEVVHAGVVRVGPATPEAPADATVAFEFQNTEGGLLTVSLRRGDDLDADNAAGLVLRRPASLRILLVRPNITSDAVDEVLRAAVESLGPASLRVVNAGEYERSPGAGADLIIFDRVRPSALPAVPSISFGATIPIPGLGVREASADAPAAPSGFLFWLRSHPVMRYVVLNDVWVSKPMTVAVPEGGEGGDASRFEVLASGEEGPLIVLVERAGVRRLIVGFDIGQSNWIKDAGFHIFLKNGSDYLALGGEEEAGRAVSTTQAFSVRPLPSASRVEVAGPVSFVREVSPGGGAVQIGPLARVGLYRIKGVVDEDALVAVNLLDPVESRIERRDALRLASGDIGGVGASAAAPREIWHWFVLAAAAGLCVEWMLYAWRMRV